MVVINIMKNERSVWLLFLLIQNGNKWGIDSALFNYIMKHLNDIQLHGIFTKSRVAVYLIIGF